MSSILKRIFDIAITLSLLCFLSPIMALVAISIRLSMGSPILFCQQRPGLNAKPFYLFKFRTMTNTCDTKGNLLPDAARLSRIGQFLRTFSLDELPELFNVLRGEMSLVGPRPLLMKYLSFYTPEQMRRHEVRPGITGWAQVNGRNGLTWEEKFNLDVWYVDNWNIALDLKILVWTFIKVIKREGINAEGCATMPEYKGVERRA